MNRNSYRLILIGLIVLAVGLFAGLTLARAENGLFKPDAVGTSFTYQGQLEDGGSPANGSYDFQFGLYDQLTLGSQVGVTQTVPSVSVSDGLFTAELDFGSGAFTGGSRYLAIAVRPAGVGAYTALAPRQAISPVPYAIYADTTVWGGIANMPAGFADGVDNGSPENVIWVAKSGGDFTSVSAALASISDASSDNPYVIKIAPGVYTETNGIDLKSYVDIEGRGYGTTLITSDGGSISPFVDGSSATIRAGNVWAEVSSLGVESNSTGTHATGIWIDGANDALAFTDVLVWAYGGSSENIGVLNTGASPWLERVWVWVWSGGSETNHGIYNYSGSSPTIVSGIANADGGLSSTGISNYGSANPTIEGVTARAANGSSSNYGIRNYISSSPVIRNSVLTGETNSLENDGTSTAQAATSRLDGAVGAGTTCLDSHTSAGEPLDTSCQVQHSSTATEAFIPAGTFQMGCFVDHNNGFTCETHELPLHPVYLDGYFIDKYQITNAQYKACVTAGSCTEPSNTTAYTDTNKTDHPVVYVSWNQADAYCSWLGKRLPTEAEWEKAARGDGDPRTYPWGEASPDTRWANFNSNVGGTTAAGNYLAGMSTYGVLDMAGNVSEWVNDWYQSDYYDDPSAVYNPAGPGDTGTHVVRGGSWRDFDDILRVSYRGGIGPTSTGDWLGFRCARTP